jgi:phosphoribosyl 1,2-cyclic phosphodiesterase
MKVHFYGVRGSIPAPQLPSQIKSKISAILECISPDDLYSPENRERFMAGLPPWLFGTVGGNTSCVMVRQNDFNEVIIFDAGTGIRELGQAVSAENPTPKHYHIFFSHYHWDHLQGLPFFTPVYNPSVKVDFYSPIANLETYLHGQMTTPYFPVHLESMAAQKTFHILEESERLALGGLSVSCKKMNHPGDSYSYRLDDGKKCFIYATDTELSANDFLKNEENTAYYSGADMIVLDSQYTIGESIDKYNWGHSAFNMAVDFAANWGIKRMAFFHHDPSYDDHKLFDMLQSARQYLERMNIKALKLSLAIEGMEIDI